MLINTSTCATATKRAKDDLARSVRIDLDNQVFTEFTLSGKGKPDLESIYNVVSEPVVMSTSWFAGNVRSRLTTDIRGHNLII